MTADTSATGVCAAKDGVVIQVRGRTDAQVTYFNEAAIPAVASGAMATTASGGAAVSGLPSGIFIEVSGTKAGCRLSPTFKTLTGRTLLGAGAISGAWLRMTNQ